MVICGIMTGTSLDGIDLAICEFGNNPSISKDYALLACGTLPFPDAFRDKLNSVIISQQISLSDLSQMNFLYSKILADAIFDFCQQTNISIDEIDAIGIHGQTLWHRPIPQDCCGYDIASTYQLGSASALSTLLNKTVVSDFRSSDIALGGEGAPLVPIFDFNFLSDANEDIIAMNIGGIANITAMPKGASEDNIMAYDVGPGNTLIDYATSLYYNQKFDSNGDIARQGKIIPDFFEQLISEKFICKVPPKSTGRELFNWRSIVKYIDEIYKPNDIIRTLTEYTAYCISKNIDLFASSQSKIIASGGGTRNKFLIRLLSQKLPNCKIVLSDELGIPSDAKEAIAFAYLAWRTINGMHGNLPNVTGAKRKAILGVIAKQ